MYRIITTVLIIQNMFCFVHLKKSHIRDYSLNNSIIKERTFNVSILYGRKPLSQCLYLFCDNTL